MSPSVKSILISQKEYINLKEQVIFQNGQEGKRVWEAGITIARYIFNNREQFSGKNVVELGSGTGIGGLALLKYTDAKNVMCTDYTDEVNKLLAENIQMQGKAIKGEYQIKLVDWTVPSHY